MLMTMFEMLSVYVEMFRIFRNNNVAPNISDVHDYV